MKTALFSLPRELRDQIYTNVLADLVLEPLYIRKFDSDPKWKFCYNPQARLPGILLVSKTIYLEAREMCLALWGPRRIVVDWYADGNRKRHYPLETKELEANRGFRVSNVEDILPILNAVQELNLEIDAVWNDSDCLPLVRWLRAVLNERPNRLRKLAIGVFCNEDARCSSDRKDIIREAREIRTQMQPPGDVWILRRRRRHNIQGPPRGNLLRGTQGPEERRLPQTMAWRELSYGENRRGVIWFWCILCDLFDIFRNHDTWFGPGAGTWRCCVFCAAVHLCHWLDPRFAALGWPSTRRRLTGHVNSGRQGSEVKFDPGDDFSEHSSGSF